MLVSCIPPLHKPVCLSQDVSAIGLRANVARPVSFKRFTFLSIPECRMQDKMCSQAVRPMRTAAFGLLVRPQDNSSIQSFIYFTLSFATCSIAVWL
jgi:hypothetical protein